MKLAINGGEKAVSIQPKEMWEPPYGEIVELLKEQVYGNRISGDWEKTYFKFEEEFKNYFGAKYCCALNMGTAALWAAFYAINLKPGDEVIVPSYTWVATITPAIYMGAKPVFCELEEGKLVADPDDIEKRITPKTKAITIVHLFGNVAHMDRIMEISRKHNIPVIEDCSHCHGAEWKGKKLGTIGNVGCFSMQGGFFDGKPVPAGEGGAVITNDRSLYNKMLLYTHMNRPQNPADDLENTYEKYTGVRFGIKFRAHPMALSIARVMLKSLDHRNELKAKYRQKMNNAFDSLKGISTIKEHADSRSAGFYGGMQMLYEKEAFDGLPIDRFIKALEAEGVNMKYRMYEPMHLMPFFQEGFDLAGVGNSGIAAQNYAGTYKKGDLPVTEKIFDKLMGMPVYTEEPEGYSDQAIKAFEKVIANYGELIKTEA